jgi:predicted O-linked N-acetylglucosamine transferase (SPINDLY family)
VPDDDDSLSGRLVADGLRLLAGGEPVMAMQRLEEAVRADPNCAAARKGYAETLVAVGTALSAAGGHQAAAPLYEQATQFDPDSVDAWANLGATYAGLRRRDDAVVALNRALQIDAGHLNARRNLGIVLKAAGQVEAARSVLAPFLSNAATINDAASAALAMPPISQSAEEIQEHRSRYAAGLDAIGRHLGALAHEGSFSAPTFALAYHGLDDRQLNERTAATFGAKVAGINYRSAWLDQWSFRGDRRIRVVIASDYLYGHTIGQLYGGVIRRLDRRQFEVVVAHGPGSIEDAFRRGVDAVADGVIHLPTGLPAQRTAIETVRPDVLFYPDVGMSGALYLLAFSRLAPRQVTAWGHPDTTGIPTVDAFISTTRFEPPGAEAHYSERLILTRDNPCFVERPKERRERLTREAFGLPPRGALFGCPQSLFKLHPDFDAVLAEIARNDPEAHIVVPALHEPAQEQMLLKRWRDHHPELVDRVVLTRRVTSEVFTAFCCVFDVLLDPLHFGSGYTFYRAAAEGVPTVTLPGEFARGRVVAGLYEQMGAGGELVATSTEDYASLALNLAHSPDRQAKLRGEIRAAASERLFDYMPAVEQLEEVFRSLVHGPLS